MENDGISISDGQEPTVNTEEQGEESNDDALLTLDGDVDKVDDPVVVTSAGNNLNEEDADNDVLIISEQVVRHYNIIICVHFREKVKNPPQMNNKVK